MKIRLGFILAVIALVAYPGMIQAKSTHLTVTMHALSGSGQNGAATITSPSGGHQTVTIDLSGEPKGASEPAHIHPGSCAKLGPVPKVALKPVVDGRSVTVIPALGSKGASWAIAVHKGMDGDMNTYDSCGDIPAW
jgi:hypothetical protein